MPVDSLSPVPRADPERSQLPYGLTWAEVTRALPELAGSREAWESHSKRGRHQGGHPSVIMTLHGTSADGSSCVRTVFFKRNDDLSREAEAYRFLSRQGVPVAPLVLCVERPAEEVIGLEFLPSIGLGPTDLEDLLDLVAALNSVSDLPPTIAGTPPGLPQADFQRLLSEAMDRVNVIAPDLDTTRWLDRYRLALPRYSALPRTLTHGELAAQQVGRTADGRLVVIDLATIGMRPRYFDIANLLAPLARLTGDSEHSLFARFLRRVDPGAPLQAAWEELRLTRFVQEVEALPWHLSIEEGNDLRQHLMIIDQERPDVW